MFRKKINRVADGLILNNRLILQMTALGFMMMASSVTGLGNASFIPSMAPEVIDMKEVPPNQNKKVAVKTLTTEEYVRNYFSDIPVMVEISKCESRFRQYDENGDVLRGVENNLDVGVMQINQYYHDKDSDKLGYDIMTIEGNTAYARHLFEKNGVQPWISSSKCWKKTVAYQNYANEVLAINK